MNKKKVKNEEIFYRPPCRNRYILGYVMAIPILFAFMTGDEIKHMGSPGEFRNVV